MQTLTKKQKNNAINNLPKSDENETKEIKRIPHKDFYKKLTIINACFVDEYNLLFVSSFNNIISAWKYNEQSFKNINYVDESDNSIIIRNSIIYSCPLFSADLPQSTMDWDPMQKKLYSGQSDGKILIWDILTSKGKEEDVLDFQKAKKKHEMENEDNLNMKEKFQEKEISKKEKRITHDGVSSIKVLGKMQMIAAGYYNGCVLLWDLMLRDYRKFIMIKIQEYIK
jgi:WD40 repeat protein